MENIVIIAILLLILVPVVSYLIKAKKSGQHCIGCPNGKNCSGHHSRACESCHGDCGGNCKGCETEAKKEAL